MLLFSSKWIQDYFFFLFLFIIYQFFVFPFAYFANKYADREEDRLAGKVLIEFNSLAKTSLILIFLASGSLIIPLFFGNLEAIFLGIINLLLAISYSFKPIRFKERGITGLLISAIGQRTLVFLFFSFLVNIVNQFTCYLSIWLFLIGLTAIIRHQIVDIKADTIADVETWSSRVGRNKAKRILNYITMVLIIYPFFALFLYPPYLNIIILIILTLHNWKDIFSIISER